MKTVLLDGELILRGLNDDGDFHRQFITLWEALQSSKLEGYISKLDWDRLQQRLNQDVGSQSSEHLLLAISRILQVWCADRHPSIDVIITENPTHASESETPIFSVAEFLKRYELDALLEQSVASATASITDSLNNSLDSQKKLSKAITTTLLLLPILAELWMHKVQLAAMLAIAPKSADESPAKASEHLEHERPDIEPVSAIERSPDHTEASSPTVETAHANAALRLSNLPKFDVSVENDIPVAIRLDTQGNVVNIRLFVTGESQGETVAATFVRRDNGHSVAQVLITPDGIVVAASPSSDTGSSAAEPNSQIVAAIQHTEAGQLTAWLRTQQLETSPHASIEGDRGSKSSNQQLDQLDQQSNQSLLSVQYVDRYPAAVPSSKRPTQAIDIRIDLNQETRDVTVHPVPNVPPPATDGVQFNFGGFDTELDYSTPSTGFPVPKDGIVNAWTVNNGYNVVPIEPLARPSTPFPRVNNDANGKQEVEDAPWHGDRLPPNVNTPVTQVFYSNSFTDPNIVIPSEQYDDLLGKEQGKTILVGEQDELSPSNDNNIQTINYLNSVFKIQPITSDHLKIDLKTISITPVGFETQVNSFLITPPQPAAIPAQNWPAIPVTVT
ncbi:MAG TPA: hypothetical protein V6C78_03520 [Crinalium sp.]